MSLPLTSPITKTNDVNGFFASFMWIIQGWNTPSRRKDHHRHYHHYQQPQPQPQNNINASSVIQQALSVQLDSRASTTFVALIIWLRSIRIDKIYLRSTDLSNGLPFVQSQTFRLIDKECVNWIGFSSCSRRIKMLSVATHTGVNHTAHYSTKLLSKSGIKSFIFDSFGFQHQYFCFTKTHRHSV